MNDLLSLFPGPLSQSLESIDKTGNAEVTRKDLLRSSSQKPESVEQEGRHVLMPCDNGQSYSVSQNQIVHLPGPDAPGSNVKNRINELEIQQGQKRKGLVLNLTNQFEAVGSKPSSPDSPDPILLQNGDGNDCGLVWTSSAELKVNAPNANPTLVAPSPRNSNKPKKDSDNHNSFEERRGSPSRQSSWGR